jgi:hypothetical protein
MICTLNKYYLGDKIEEDKTGSVYGAHGTADIYVQDYDEKASRNTYGRIMLQRTSGIS